MALNALRLQFNALYLLRLLFFLTFEVIVDHAVSVGNALFCFSVQFRAEREKAQAAEQARISARRKALELQQQVGRR